MATIGSMIVNLLCNTSQFDAGMAKARGKAAGLSKALSSDLSKSLRSTASSFAATGIAAVGAAVGVGKFMGFMERLENIGNVAKSLSMTSAELSKLQYVAKMTDVENFDSALKRFVKTMGDVRQGTGTAAKSFEMLGINISEFSGKSVTDQLKEFADKIKDLSKPDQLSILTKTFGRGAAADMVRFFEGGSTGIQRLTAEAKKFGAVFDDTMVKAAGDFNDAIDRMKYAMAGFAAPTATTIAGDLSTFANDQMRRRNRRSAAGKSNEGYLHWAGRNMGEWFGSTFGAGGTGGGGRGHQEVPAEWILTPEQQRLQQQRSRAQQGAGIMAQIAISNLGLGGAGRPRPNIGSAGATNMGIGTAIGMEQLRAVQQLQLMGIGTAMGMGGLGGGKITRTEEKVRQQGQAASNSLLQVGTAEAFRQMNKQNPQVEVAKKQLKSQEKSEGYLKKISETVGKTDQAITVEL